MTPAADLPTLAKLNSAKLVIVNKQATPLDENADMLIHADIERVIELIASQK